MRLIFLSILLIFRIAIFAQLSAYEANYLSDALFKKVNALRLQKNLEPLKEDSALIKAANLHSVYMARVNRLSHKESTRKLKTPELRVRKFSNEFELVGENILFIESKKKKLKAKKMDAVAEEMFIEWKESPRHYANMIHSCYELAGFGFARGKKGKLYVTHVMGTKGIVVSGQLSDNAFGIKPNDNSCDQFLRSRDNFVVNMGNSLRIRGDKVIMYHHSKSLVEEMLPGSKDAVAIDIVSRDQFECGTENIIDFSPIYDGVMLKPLNKWQLYKNNTALSDFRLVSEVGKIPESLIGKDINANLIYIINGKRCRYHYPVYIPAADYSLVNVEPRLVNPKEYPFLKWGIVDSETLYFDFDRGMTSPIRKNKGIKIEGKLKEVDVVSYSSIEGDSISNAQLQQQRATYIQKYLKKILKVDELPTRVRSKENWETMYFQLELLGLNKMKNKSRAELREFVASDTLHNWDSLLYIQRRSFATIRYEGKLNPSDSLYYQHNFQSAIYKNNTGLANRSLAEIYQRNSLEFYMFQPAEMEYILSKPSLVQNTSAILTNIYHFNLEQSVLYLRHWLSNQHLLTLDAKYNLSILYSKVVRYILDDWDVSSKVFAKIVNPNKIKTLIKEFEGDEEFSKLILNYHLTAIKYYGQNNNEQGLNSSFAFIENYFKKVSLSIEDEIALCLFYNNWSRYDLTIEMLLKRYKQKDFNEFAAFILAQTSMAYPSQLQKEELMEVMNSAFMMNKKRWCNWIKEEFQHLRYKEVKEIYCKECSAD